MFMFSYPLFLCSNPRSLFVGGDSLRYPLYIDHAAMNFRQASICISIEHSRHGRSPLFLHFPSWPVEETAEWIIEAVYRFAP